MIKHVWIIMWPYTTEKCCWRIWWKFPAILADDRWVHGQMELSHHINMQVILPCSNVYSLVLRLYSAFLLFLKLKVNIKLQGTAIIIISWKFSPIMSSLLIKEFYAWICVHLYTVWQSLWPWRLCFLQQHFSTVYGHIILIWFNQSD